MKRQVRKLVAVSTVLCGLTLLAGCGEDDVQELSLESLLSSAQSAGHKQQAAALEDGVITVEEFGGLNAQFVECARGSGLQVSNTDVSPVDGFTSINEIGWTKVGEKDGVKALESCTQKFLNEARPAMVHFGEWETPQEVLAPMRKCVEDRGLAPDAAANNYRDLFLSVQGQGVSVQIISECLENAIAGAYGEPQAFQPLVSLVSVAQK